MDARHRRRHPELEREALAARLPRSRWPPRRSRRRRRSWWTTAPPTARSSCWAESPGVRVLSLGRNTGFAFAANRGVEAGEPSLVALVNTDIELEPDWLERMAAALERRSRRGVGGVQDGGPPATRRCSTTRATCCAATARASSAGASSATTAASTSPARCSAPAPGPRSTGARGAGRRRLRRALLHLSRGRGPRAAAAAGRLALPLRAGGGPARGRGLVGAALAPAGLLGGAEHAAAARQGVPAALAPAGRVPAARLGLARAARAAPAAPTCAARWRRCPLLPGDAARAAALRGRRACRWRAVVPARPIRGRRAGRPPLPARGARAE